MCFVRLSSVNAAKISGVTINAMTKSDSPTMRSRPAVSIHVVPIARRYGSARIAAPLTPTYKTVLTIR